MLLKVNYKTNKLEVKKTVEEFYGVSVMMLTL